MLVTIYRITRRHSTDYINLHFNPHNVYLITQAPRHVGGGYIASSFSISAADEGKQWASRPDRFTSEESAPGTQWIGGWVGPRAGLVAVEKGKTSCLAGNRTRAVHSVAIPTELSRVHRQRIIPCADRKFLGQSLHVPNAGQPCSRIKIGITKCYVSFMSFIFNISFQISETKYCNFH
jgi:hypothetical protein